MTNVKVNLLTVIIIVIVLLIGGGILFHKFGNDIKSLNTIISDKTKTANALNDTIKFYTNKYNEVVGEKLTLQGTVKAVNDKNNNLNENQKNLIKRINDVNKKNSLIVAANIRLSLKMDSLVSVIGVYNPAVNGLTFKKTSDQLSYNVNVTNVAQIKDKESVLEIIDLTIPNKQFIEFHWKNDAKQDYPISFSITNSNKYFVTNDIDSYAIPEINKRIIKPNFWQKIGNFFSKTSGKITVFGTGVGVGALGIFLLVK